MRITSLLLGLSLAAAAALPSLANTLTSAQIEEQFVGKRFIATYQGIESRVLYGPAGNVRVTGSSLAGEGTWSLSDGSFCVTMTSGPLLGNSCVTISSRLDGGFAMSNGMTFTPGR